MIRAALTSLLLAAAIVSSASAVDPPNLPRVFLIGDSISIGYHNPVKQLLLGKAEVQRPKTNCGPTSKGVAEIDKWLGDGKWDVIHFNWGLHDLKYMKGNQRVAPSEGKLQVPPEAYEKNLRTLVARLKKTGAKLIWCTTTPVPEGASWRVADDSVRYNAIAKKVMDDEGIETNDLHGCAKSRIEKIQRPKDVHFTKVGSQALAEQVSKAIEAALAK